MPRKAIHRELHDKKVDHTKPYSVIGQRGQIRTVSGKPSDKVSETVEEKREDDVPKNALHHLKKTEELETEEVEESSESEEKQKDSSSKRKANKRGRPTKKAETSTEDSEI